MVERDMLSKLIGQRNEADVVVGGVASRCLLDTGSQISFVSEGFYHENLACQHPLNSLGSLNIRIEGAGGQPLHYIGYTVADVKLPKMKSTYEALLFICPDTNYSSKVPVLIGTNILDRCFESSGNLPKELAKLRKARSDALRFCSPEDGSVGVVTVQSKRAIIIKPGETRTIPGASRNCPVSQSFPAVLDETVGPSELPDGLLLKSSLITMSGTGRSRVNVPVTNTSRQPVVIRPKTIVAELFMPEWVRSVGWNGKDREMGNKTARCDAATANQKEGPSFTLDPSMSDEWKQRANSLLADFSDVFSKHDFDIGRTDSVEHKISLTDDTPFRERSRPIPPKDLEDARRHIAKLLEANIIRESKSPYASPICLVRKKNGDVRLTVDYRRLNRRTVKDAYALPRIEDAFSKLSGCKWYSVMDLKSGFYNVPMAESDRHKTAFICPLGFYEFNRMPQGVTNAPATFQRLMECCLGTMNLSWAIAFLDDLIVFSHTLEEHEERLRAALTRLRQFGLKLSPEKCSFFQCSVRYLGHIISKQGIRTDPAKIAAVSDWPRPQNMVQLRSYLGFVGFYRRFVKDFSKVARPLNELLKGYTKQGPNKGKVVIDRQRVKAPFGDAWTGDCDGAFQALKNAVVSAPVLTVADPSLPYELHTDASMTGLGAALYQKKDGRLHPVAFASRSLSNSEKNYPVHKLEFLALKWAVTEKFHDYLYGATFMVLTDSNPMTYVMTTARLDATGQRWVAALSLYDFKISYIQGKRNVAADGLSRRPHESSDEDDWDQADATRQLIERARPATTEGPGSEILTACSATCNVSLVESVTCSIGALTDLSDDPTDGMAIVSMRPDQLVEAQQGDLAVSRVRELVEANQPLSPAERKNEAPAVRSLLRNFDAYEMSDGLLFRNSILSERRHRRLVVPESLQKQVLNGVHDQIGHLGADRAVNLARTRFYWLNMEIDIQDYCKKCPRCVIHKAPAQRAASLGSLMSNGPMDLVCIDFLSIEPDRSGKEDTDHFTRFSRAFVCRNQTAKQVAEQLWKGFFLDFGLPRRLHSDRGANFTGKLLAKLKEMTGISSSFTTPYHPQGNGQCERFNRTLLGMLGTLSENEKLRWSGHVKYMTHAYNCTRHEATGFSPCELMFGRQPRLPVDWYFGTQPTPEGTVPFTSMSGTLRTP
jgi:hypothetical protein